VRAQAAIGCDGIHSALRKLLHPDEGPLSYQGINMWRGVTRAKPFLTGASMVIGGWLEVGKLVVYPIRDPIDAEGRQLVNWVAEIQSPRNVMQDWNLRGRLEDFLPAFESWKFDWLDCAGLLRAADLVLEYPMVDREPLPFWTQGRVTLGRRRAPMASAQLQRCGAGDLDARTLAGASSAARCTGSAPRPTGSAPGERLRRGARQPRQPRTLLAEVHRHRRPAIRPHRRGDQRSRDARARGKYQRIAGFERGGARAAASLA
jgi:hypothetical protein